MTQNVDVESTTSIDDNIVTNGWRWNDFRSVKCVTLTKTNMTIKNPPFEDVFPIVNGDFPMLR